VSAHPQNNLEDIVVAQPTRTLDDIVFADATGSAGANP
jgi:hypothetical protein